MTLDPSADPRIPHLELPEPADCLGPTPYIESTHPDVLARLASLGIDSLGPEDKAAALFRHVRDRIRYEFLAKITPEEYHASHVLSVGRGFCVQKSVLLAALARAAGIPAALVLTDLKDLTLSPKIVAALGTDVMHFHGLNAFHLGGRWRFADASLSPDVVSRKGYRLVEFDGRRDALLAADTAAGQPHAVYAKFHGVFADLPFDRMMEAFIQAYSNADVEALASLGYRL